MKLTLVITFLLAIAYTVTCLPLFLDPERPNSLTEIRKTDALLLDRWKSAYPTRSKTNPLIVPLPSLLDPIATYKTPEAGYIDEHHGNPKKRQKQLATIMGITDTPNRNNPGKIAIPEVLKAASGPNSKENKGLLSKPKRVGFWSGQDDALMGVENSGSRFRQSTTPPTWSTKGKMDGLWPIPPAPPPVVDKDPGCLGRFMDWCKSAWSKIKNALKVKVKPKPKPKVETAAPPPGSPGYNDYEAKGRQDWFCCEDCWSSGRPRGC